MHQTYVTFSVLSLLDVFAIWHTDVLENFVFQTKQDETHGKEVEDAAELPDLEEGYGEEFSDSFMIPGNDDVTDNPQQEFVCCLFCIVQCMVLNWSKLFITIPNMFPMPSTNLEAQKNIWLTILK